MLKNRYILREKISSGFCKARLEAEIIYFGEFSRVIE